MKIRASMTAVGLVLLAAAGLGGCATQPIELTVHCAAGGTIVGCRGRTAELLYAYQDPERLKQTVPELGSSDFDRPTTIEHDRGSTVEHDRGTTVEHDVLRCKFRNRQLREAFQRCHQILNDCSADGGTTCNADYRQCYDNALKASPFTNT